MRILFSALILFYFSSNIQAQERRNIIWFTEKSSASATGFEVGQTIPNLSIKDVNKKRVNLHDQLNKVTILDFRSIDCQACSKSNNNLRRFYEKYAIEIISIYNDNSSNKVRNYAKKNQLIWTNVQDNAPPKEQLKKLIGLQAASPDFVIISPDKKILKVFDSGNTIGKLGAFLQQHFK